jgi:hypothetical protein
MGACADPASPQTSSPPLLPLLENALLPFCWSLTSRRDKFIVQRSGPERSRVSFPAEQHRNPQRLRFLVVARISSPPSAVEECLVEFNGRPGLFPHPQDLSSLHPQPQKEPDL